MSIALSVTDTESGDGTVTIPEASIDETLSEGQTLCAMLH